MKKEPSRINSLHHVEISKNTKTQDPNEVKKSIKCNTSAS
jgi:hypothetical protein